MTTSIIRMTGEYAYDLIYTEHLVMLPIVEQETMQRAMHNSSVVWVCYNDLRVLCCWGVIAPTMLSNRGYLWLYTTKLVHEHLFILGRHSRRAITEALREYPILVGHCKTGATKSHRWLRWLGAEFGEPQDDFIPFEIRA